LEIRERIGTAEARQLLRRLAQGDPAARVTRAAANALQRLNKARQAQ
jgi:hypothetical protein